MKVTAIGGNASLAYGVNGVILISYSTPVGASIPGHGYFVTKEKYSITTTRHINKWIGETKHRKMPADFFEWLLNNLDNQKCDVSAMIEQETTKGA